MTAPASPSWPMACACLQGFLSAGRGRSGLTQPDVAKALRVSLRTFKRFEAGEAEPRMLQLFRWADLVGVDILSAFRGEGANSGTSDAKALANVLELRIPAGVSLPHDLVASGSLLVCGENAARSRIVHGKSRVRASRTPIGAAA